MNLFRGTELSPSPRDRRSAGALPWYQVTRAEIALLAACAPPIAHHVKGEPFTVELVPGNGDKLLRGDLDAHPPDFPGRSLW
jgi:uncharacterized SAM-dependent methyltransferase